MLLFRGPAPGRRAAGLVALTGALCLAGCGSRPPAPASPEPDTPGQPAAQAPAQPGQASGTGWPGANGRVVGRHERLLVYLPAEGDTLAGVAARLLQDSALAWQIAQANGQRWTLNAGQPLIVPLQPPPALGVSADAVQTVPILCYHRLGGGSNKMVVTPAQFEAQIELLAREHYQVLRLADLADFLAGRRALPQRSVVITFDDGYESVYRHAFPVLKKHGFAATLFIYTDFIGARDALSWAQLEEMSRSGLVDVQAHSKSHRNLSQQGAAESDAAYANNLDNETRTPRTLIERRLTAPEQRVRHFAYPYGDANDAVLQALQRQRYDLAFTVVPGGNPFYAHPQLLKRTMIFGDFSLDDFRARLQTRRPLLR